MLFFISLILKSFGFALPYLIITWPFRKIAALLGIDTSSSSHSSGNHGFYSDGGGDSDGSSDGDCGGGGDSGGGGSEGGW